MRFFNGPGPIQRVALLGNHTPRQCGIATFTADLHQAIATRFPALDCFVAAMNDTGRHYLYPPCVRLQIAQEEPLAYRQAAESLNARGVDVLSLQHEYGIYGGERGAHVLGLLREARMPVVTTLHTILSQPDPQQWKVMDEITRLSERIVVMSSHGAELLRRVHGVPASKIDLIPHGIPAVPFDSDAKAQLGFAGRPLILTFGLLAPDKGIEYVIDAMPAILARFPTAAYLVVGATHPNVKAEHGEAYRDSLVARARALGVRESIVFVDRFVSLEELTDYLAAADIYITPYLKAEQITSGTLAYAVGSGKAVISTPYLYAKELLAEGRGILVPWRDGEAIAGEVVGLLGDSERLLALRHRAADFGRSMVWPAVARRYLESFQRARKDHRTRASHATPYTREPGLALTAGALIHARQEETRS
jgi:glycosyltransferase involved in cell wall biosynthesis